MTVVCSLVNDSVMPNEYSGTREFAGAIFRDADLSGISISSATVAGLRIRDSYAVDVKIAGSVVENMRINRHDARGTVFIDDVDVTDFVAAELDRRHPERVQLRLLLEEPFSAEELRQFWGVIEQLWSATVAHAERLPTAALFERVDDEFSLVDTLRHLVFAIDCWLGRVFRGEVSPFHPIGLPHTDFPRERLAEVGIVFDLEAQPEYADALLAFNEHLAQVRTALASATDALLAQTRTGSPLPVYDEETMPVGAVLGVIMEELIEHRRYAERDLGKLEQAAS
jgi:hypothetical protein